MPLPNITIMIAGLAAAVVLHSFFDAIAPALIILTLISGLVLLGMLILALRRRTIEITTTPRHRGQTIYAAVEVAPTDQRTIQADRIKQQAIQDATPTLPILSGNGDGRAALPPR